MFQKKKNVTRKEDISRFLTILKKEKESKGQKYKNNITVPFMVGAGKGVEGLMILTKRVAALPLTIVFYHNDVLLVHFVYCVIFCFCNSWSMQFLND